MLDDSDRLLSTIEQVLRTGRLGPSARKLNCAPIDLGALVDGLRRPARATCTAFRPAAIAIGRARAPPLTIIGDFDEVRAAVSNLIDNAVKYSGSDVRRDGRRRWRRPVRHGAGQRPGPGHSEDRTQANFPAFLPGARALAARVKGTGLGLYIVRSVAQRHGGRAWAESEGAGRGSTFVLQFPRGLQIEGGMNVVRIFWCIVEDEQHLADGLRFNLKPKATRCRWWKRRGRAGTTACDRRAFDLVVLDVMLPGIDGFEVMSEMRKAGQFIPTLMLTARGHPEDVLKGFAAGADDYLPKPFELAILMARIKGCCAPRMGAPPPRLRRNARYVSISAKVGRF